MRCRHGLSIVLALLGSVALADRPVPTTREGRESNAVLLWTKADAVVRVTVQAGDQAKDPHEVEVTEALKGPLSKGTRVTVPPAEFFRTGKGGTAMRGGDVALEKGKEYVLFLGKSGEEWSLLEEGLFDGWGGGPGLSDFGFLERGGMKIDGALDASETGKTLLALSRLEDPDASLRIDGLRILLRYRWRMHGEVSPDPIPAIHALGPGPRGKLLDGAILDDFGACEVEDWAFVQEALVTSPGGLLTWAEKATRGGHMRQLVIALVSGADEDEARQRAMDAYLACSVAACGEHSESARFLARHGSEWLDARLVAHLESALKGGNWNEARKAAEYLDERKSAKGLPVRNLVKFVSSSEAGRLHGQTALLLMDLISTATGVSMKPKEVKREAILEGHAWADWWENEGKDDPRYK